MQNKVLQLERSASQQASEADAFNRKVRPKKRWKPTRNSLARPCAIVPLLASTVRACVYLLYRLTHARVYIALRASWSFSSVPLFLHLVFHVGSIYALPPSFTSTLHPTLNLNSSTLCHSSSRSHAPLHLVTRSLLLRLASCVSIHRCLPFLFDAQPDPRAGA